MPDPDPTHWREDTDPLRLGTVVDRLKDRVDVAIVQRDNATGEPAHEHLVSAEWRLRRAKRRAGSACTAGSPSIALDGSKPALRPCPRCASTIGRLDPPKPPHGHGVRCAACDRHLGWMPKIRDGSDDVQVIEG